MFKTMWKMPAKLVRLPVAGNDEGDAQDTNAHSNESDDTENGAYEGRAVIARGSLEDMVRAADAIADEEGTDVMIECVGRDRPILWPEIKGLRAATNFPATG